MPLRELLERNRQWAQRCVDHDPDYFRRHVGGQTPTILCIGCSDSRVPLETILDCGPGDLFVHRNIANVVGFNDVNIGSVVQYAVENLKVSDIIVSGHYGCGGVAAACDPDQALDGYLGDWLMIVARSARSVRQRLATEGRADLPRDQFLRMVVEENVRRQVTHLSELTLIRKSWRERGAMPRLHGWVYDIADGLMHVVADWSGAMMEDLASAPDLGHWVPTGEARTNGQPLA